MPTNSVRAIYETRDGTMWFGTWQAGAVRWNVGQASRLSQTLGVNKSGATPDLPCLRYTTTNGLADDRVVVFHEDADGA